jgi:hypothetical protein
MQKPEVRIIEPQQEETRVVDASQSERDYLLAKYGYKQISEPSYQEESYNPNQHLTFEEMVALEERKEMEKRRKEMERRNTPRPYTFDGDRVNYHESKYSDLDLDGQNLGIQVQIVSDMPINNNNRR